MQNLATVLALIVVAEHFYIMYLEMCKFPARKPRGFLDCRKNLCSKSACR